MRRISTIGRPGTNKEESDASTDSTFDVNPRMSQFSERFIFDDDSGSGSSTRLSSLQRNIWDDQQGLGNGPSAIGSSSYLPRYLQMGGDDDDETFPTMVCFVFHVYLLHECASSRSQLWLTISYFAFIYSALSRPARWTWPRFRIRLVFTTPAPET